MGRLSFRFIAVLGSVGFDAKLGVGRVGSLRLLGIWSSGRPTELTEMGPRIPGPDPELLGFPVRSSCACISFLK